MEIDYRDVDSAEQERFLSIWQQWLKTANKRITLLSRLYQSAKNGPSMLVRGLFYGESNEAKCIIAPFLALKGAQHHIETMTFLQAVTIIGRVYPHFEKFDSVSRIILRDLNRNEIRRSLV